MAKKKVAQKTKVTIALGKAPMMMGEPMDYSKMPKVKGKKGGKKC
jgi:hypothetical protein